MKTEAPTKKFLALIWLALVIFHFTILGSAYLNLKWFNTPFIVALALVQMLLVILFFMEMRWSKIIFWLFIAAGFFWLAIQLALTSSDYLTRGWH